MTANPYNIKTKAGQELWTFLNNKHGSNPWGTAGNLILEIERQAIEAERSPNYSASEYLEAATINSKLKAAPCWEYGDRHYFISDGSGTSNRICHDCGELEEEEVVE